MTRDIVPSPTRIKQTSTDTVDLEIVSDRILFNIEVSGGGKEPRVRNRTGKLDRERKKGMREREDRKRGKETGHETGKIWGISTLFLLPYSTCPTIISYSVRVKVRESNMSI